ncbi:PAS domain-containing sensor histidine kinase [Niallia endozanthoxylica]|uniref:histidine kinase n=1 Tax=Niallia endozanthoxylica TaxID=2036016 RepID=A0A5J5HNN8_9BACI|nr:PAS domain S-box protein [Niallia endozanthoxylica]KAA9021603.1 PAS domain S-box protein [Niallia endozanthoxylica]
MENPNNFGWEFETIAKHTLDIIIIIDENQKVRYVTPSFRTIFGLDPEVFVGENVFDPVHPDDKENLMEAHRQVLKLQIPKTNEYRVFDANGEIKYFESRVMPVPHHPDRLAVVTIRDITDRKMMENELKTRKNRYEELQNSLKTFSQDLSSVMKLSDLEERLIKEITFIFPHSKPNILKFHREKQKVEGRLYSAVEAQLSQLAMGKIEHISDKIHIRIGDRREYSFILVLHSPSINEEMDSIWLETLICFTVMVFENLNVIENLMNRLEEIMQSNETPQWVLRLLFNLQEQQRQNLSSDLHDTILQDQVDLFRRLEALQKQKEIQYELKNQLKEIGQGLLDTIHQIRMTCNELRPPLLKELGLERALENLFEYTQLSSTFKIMFETDMTNSLMIDEELTIGIYRITQELLNNAAKHSKASMLHFQMSTQDTLKIYYYDDGVGFEREKLTPTFHSMGLTGIRQRVQSLNGKIEFDSVPGQGVAISMDFPIQIS